MPVPTVPQIAPNFGAMDVTTTTTAAQAQGLVGDVLDVDDLQNFFPWDLYGLMEIGEVMSQNGTEDGRSNSWAGAY